MSLLLLDVFNRRVFALVAELGRDEERDGFIWHWTCFKPTPDSTVLAGQWLAWRVLNVEEGGPRYFYSSTPGAVGEYSRGDMFDTSQREGQLVVCAEETDPLWNPLGALRGSAACWQAYERLVRHLRGLGFPVDPTLYLP